MSCSISGEGAGAPFQRMAESLSSCVERVRSVCSARVSARATGIALVVIGLLVIAAGVIVAATGVGCAVSVSAGLILVMIGSFLLGLGVAKVRSRRSELERQMLAIESRIQALKDEHDALQEVYDVNRQARQAVSKHCYELEQRLDDMCKKHADAVGSLEEDFRCQLDKQVGAFRSRLQQSQNTCSRLTEELCQMTKRCSDLKEQLKKKK